MHELIVTPRGTTGELSHIDCSCGHTGGWAKKSAPQRTIRLRTEILTHVRKANGGKA